MDRRPTWTLNGHQINFWYGHEDRRGTRTGSAATLLAKETTSSDDLPDVAAGLLLPSDGAKLAKLGVALAVASQLS